MHLDSVMIGRELKSLRDRNNKTIEEVSNDLGIHYNTLSKYEKNSKDMQMGMLLKILDYYGINELIFFKLIREYNHINNKK